MFVPVWDWIAAQQPDRLLLLGDSSYFDIATALHPRDMPDWAFAQHIHQLQPHGIAERLGDLGHAGGLRALDIWIYDGLAAPLARGSLLLGGKLQIDRHRSTYID